MSLPISKISANAHDIYFKALQVAAHAARDYRLPHKVCHKQKYIVYSIFCIHCSVQNDD